MTHENNPRQTTTTTAIADNTGGGTEAEAQSTTTTVNTESNSISIIKLSGEDAKGFFMENSSYCDLKLPAYINFENLLKEINDVATLKYNDLKSPYPSEFESVNYVIQTNKDGSYNWRPLSLIHPVFYIILVNLITEESKWEMIQEKFKEFKDNSRVETSSLPRKSLQDNKHKGRLILHWWRSIEQKSIELSLEYSHLLHTDISGCYNSIYTHSIPWALHGKEFAKKNKDKNKNKGDKHLGNQIDKVLQWMSYGQTNGIPQGSALMDFIAEMVLGSIDVELSKKIEENHKGEDYRILRYRDDYRIFTKSKEFADNILKHLTEVLRGYGLKLNYEKTIHCDNPLLGSIKPDKIAWLSYDLLIKILPPQKSLLLIYKFAQEFPNSGSLVKALKEFTKRLEGKDGRKKYTINQSQIPPIISIAVRIGIENPRTYPDVAVILGHLLSRIKEIKDKEAAFKGITDRFKKIPNTEQIQLWLQRISLKTDLEYYRCETPLCRLIDEEAELARNLQKLETLERESEELGDRCVDCESQIEECKEFMDSLEDDAIALRDIWASGEWLNGIKDVSKIKDALCRTLIFNKDEYYKMGTVPSSDETKTFGKDYPRDT